MSRFLKFFFAIILILFSKLDLYADDFFNNTLNNHGSLGAINTPSARFYDESSFSFTLYDGTPDRKGTFTSSPFDWLEASIFYTSIDGKPYPGYDYQDYKDKGFNVKIRLKEEGILPALAIGINDIAGTGFYSSEYLVASYGINKLDMHFGLGWGTLNGTKDFKNPFRYIDEQFNNRPVTYEDEGGQFQPSRYFSGKDTSPFFGLSYVFNDKFIFKAERDTTLTPGRVGFENADSRISFGLDYRHSKNFTIGLAAERNNYYSIRFSYKNNSSSFANSINKERRKIKKIAEESKYNYFKRNLENEGIGVNKIIKKGNKIGLEITQFVIPNLDLINNIINEAAEASNIEEDVVTNYKIVDMTAIENFDDNFENEADLIYVRKKQKGFSTNNKISFRPFLAAREGFLKGSILFENDLEYLFNDNFIFASNIKYSIWDNFDDFYIPPVDTYPAQVRSDIKDYLKNFNNGPIIGRAQIDYYKTLSKNNHFMISAGIFEEMFSGVGVEYLNFDGFSSYAYGFEAFYVKKRDYNLLFDHLDYSTTSGHFNYYYRNYGRIPFDLKLSLGKYLAGDIGGTIQVSRSFRNGTQFGVFATFTDVSTEQYGEGSFDKGIYFNIPIVGNFINYSWRPLTKDPGAKLTRKNNLYDLMVRFKPIN